MACESKDAVLRARLSTYGPNTSIAYEEPLQIVRGVGCLLYDERGLEYLDAVNNVAHVGHSHPKVSAATSLQLHTVNTNSRYLHEALTTYARELLATFPPSIETLYLCNSGSEANDLALRIARAARPGATHVAVMASAYHGHLTSLIELSPYKFWGRGGAGKPDYVHVLPCPDPYRGDNLDGRRAARAAVAAAHRAGGRLCAFFCESVLSCGGQVVPPPGYLQDVYAEMRLEGAVCISDEVQCGFGRVGDAFWGFGAQGVVPDIVTMGKSIGNGYPVSALVTTRPLAQAFSQGGMEYFNTFGGSTASCAAGLATLRAVQDEGLQEHAKQVGQYLRDLLTELQTSFPIMGDVRGVGLMCGVEFVLCPKAKTHAPRVARWVKERMREHRILLSTDGPYDNVIKMKPPLPFGRPEAARLVGTMREVLSVELTPAVWASLLEEEAAHALEVVGPRMARYRANEASMYSLLQASEAGRLVGRRAQSSGGEAGASLGTQPASGSPRPRL